MNRETRQVPDRERERERGRILAAFGKSRDKECKNSLGYVACSLCEIREKVRFQTENQRMAERLAFGALQADTTVKRPCRV